MLSSSKMSLLNKTDGGCGKQWAEYGGCMTPCTSAVLLMHTFLYKLFLPKDMLWLFKSLWLS